MKAKFLIGLLIIVVIIITGVYFLMPKSITCKNYALNEAHKITDKINEPQGTWLDMKSPDGNSRLERIVIDPDDPNIMDESWRIAYYSKTENIFWIADMPGFHIQWYGPYKDSPCLW